MDLHSTLKRQLAKLSLAGMDRAPDLVEFVGLVEQVSNHYLRMDEDRTLLERSLECSMGEMNEAHNKVDADLRMLKNVLSAIDRVVIQLRSLPLNTDDEDLRTKTAFLDGVVVDFENQVEKSLSGSSSGAASSTITSIRGGFNELVKQFMHLLAAASSSEQNKHEREVAQAVQAMLLPSANLEAGGVVVAGMTLPAGLCGGDWWTAAQLRDGRVITVIGDVTGHGLSSAMLTAVAKASYDVARAALKSLTLDSLFKLMNIGIFESARRHYFMTAFALLWDDQTKQATVASAGHLNPLWISSAGVQTLATTGSPLGMSSAFDVEQKVFTLGGGDTVVLYTDGITEARNRDGEEFGEKRLRALCQDRQRQAPEALRDEIISSVTRFSGGGVEDDLTVVVMRVV